MKFNLNFTPNRPNFSITHHDNLFFIGSCFSDEIGFKFKEHLYKVEINPFGNLFNPLSIYTCLNNLVQSNNFDTSLAINRDGYYYSYLHHSAIGEPTVEALQEKINFSTKNSANFLKSSDYLFITFGTAFYYYHLQLKQTVANCHKQLSSTFEKCLASPDNIVSKYNLLIKNLKEFNPKLKIVFTVSPVKHLRDGVIENNLSKAYLIAAVHELVKQHDNCHYFPSYELINDDLRDYRFYKSDLAHPNEAGVEYVWEKLVDCYFNNEEKQLQQKIQQYKKALSHQTRRKTSQQSEKHSIYLNELRAEINAICPVIEF